MALALLTGDARQIIDDVLKLHQKMKAGPELMEQVHKKLKHLNRYLGDLEAFLDDNQSLERDAPNETKNIRRTLKEINSATREVLWIFKDWERDDYLGRKAWSFGSGPDKLRDLSEEIDGFDQHVFRWIQLQQSRLLIAIQQNIPRSPAAPLPVLRPKSVLFLDNYDNSRAVIARCYADLLRHWTEESGNVWPLGLVQSAGVRVQDSRNMTVAQKAQYMPTVVPGAHPNKIALNALFDNRAFLSDYKDRIWSDALVHPAQSLPQDYPSFDYVIVFDDWIRRDFERVTGYLERQRLISSSQTKPINLAHYHANSGVRQIDGEGKNRDNRDGWNRSVSQIKVAFKEFLIQELDWKRPLPTKS